MPRFIQRLPRPLRGVLGIAPAALAAFLTYSVAAFYGAPYVLCFAAVIFSSWYLGMTGGVVCAVSCGLLTDYFLSFPPFSLTLLQPGHLLRFVTFLIVSIFLGWCTRMLGRQRELFATQQLTRELEMAAADRRLLKEREEALQLLRDKDIRLRLALKAGRVGLAEWDLTTGRMSWSDEQYELMGLKPGSVEPTCELWRQSIFPDDLPEVERIHKAAKENGAPISYECRVVWPDGSIHWMDTQAQVEWDREGRPIRLIGVVAEVTHRKHAEAKLLRSEKLAIAGRFAAALAHEINNPLEGMVNLLYLAAGSQSLDEARRHADAALSQLMRIARITRRRLQFHKQSEPPTEARVSEIINQVLNAFRPRIAASEVHLECMREEEPVLLCLTSDIEQVFANLVANALDSMPEGGRLVIRTRRCRDWRDRSRWGVRTTLVDSGHGMNLATRKSIYDPFFTTRPETGTGLGMWITAEIVNRLGGDLRVWSSRLPSAPGTAYSLFLPETQQPTDKTLSEIHTGTLTS